MTLSKEDGGGLLLLEDDRGTCELEAQRLEPLGLRVRKCHSVEEALAELRSATPELMLVDYSLPGTNALDFIESVKQSGPDLPPFLVVTGRGDETVAVAAMKAGACDYLVKNNDFLEALLPAVRKSLEKIRLLRELEAAQKSTARNLHLYTFLAQVNLAASQTRDRESLFRRICEVAVETGGLRMAWIGLLDSDLDRLLPFCWAGTVDNYLDGIKVDVPGSGPASNGPTGRAAVLLKTQASPDIAADPTMAPWRDRALERGYRSSAAIPLQENGRLAGVLTIYSEEAGFFSGLELNLLEEIRADISLALDAIAAEEKRAAAQTALEHTSSQLAHIMDLTPVMLFKLRLTGSGGALLEWVSGNAEELTGYAPEEALRPGWVKENMHPDDLAYPVGIGEIMTAGSLVRDFRFRHKSGEYFWVHAQLKLSDRQKGEVTGSWTDITQLKESERQMQLLSDAVGTSFDEVYIFDPESLHFIFANQSAFANLGYSPAEMQRLTPWEIQFGFTEASLRSAVAPLLSREQRVLLFETAHVRKDGSVYPVEVRLQLVESAGERYFLAVVNDLTERKNSERMMAEMANMQRVESLGALAGGIAHDFNNMLTGIMANLSLLAARCAAGENSDIIRDTLEAARSAQTLTTQLLAFSKGGKPVKTEFCLRQSLQGIFTLATRGARTSQALLLPEDLWSVEGDEGQLKQAINNLLVNALQAMPSGGTLTLKAENAELPGGGSPLPPGKYVRVAVSDTGIGIPKEYLARVFEPYFTTKSQGHGLGLSMTWSVIKNHGGHIEAVSEPGKGTSFELLLPATGRPVCPERAPGKAAVKGSGRVLLLEDEDIVIRAAKRMMAELGYECAVTEDGVETLKLYDAEASAGRPFDAVIMDLTIPGGMGGKEAGAELRRRHPEAVIIVSSGYSDEPVMADYKAFGFDAVLPKPYRYEDLAETLARLLVKNKAT